MKPFLLLSIILSLLVSSSCTIPNTDDSNNTELGWNLHWSDEFDDGVFDDSKWTREVMPPGTVNKEWQRYIAESTHSWEADGNMVLKLSYDGPTLAQGNYTSARINSSGKFDFTYGKIQARIRIDYMEQGVWPAFWMLGSSCDEYGGPVGWPDCGEIDILEVIGGTDATSQKDREREAWTTIHWRNPVRNPINDHDGRKYENGMLVLDEPVHGDAYHIYEVIWDEKYITTLLDGKVFFSASIEGANKSEFHEDFFLLFNIACGGEWPGNPTLQQDVHMYVDWVRVYKKDELNPPSRPVVPLRNGTFDGTPAFWQPIGFNWEFGYPGGWDQTRASYDIVNNEYVCDLIYPAEDWNPKIRQIGLTLFGQHSYTLRFDARSIGTSRNIIVQCGPTERDIVGGDMYLHESLQLSTAMKTFEYTFTASDTIYNGGVFFLCGLETADVVLDNIELVDNTDPSLYD